MKFEIDKKVLLEVVNELDKVIDKKSSLPALANVLIECKGKHAVFSGSDVECTQIIKKKVYTCLPGSISFPIKALSKMLRVMPDGIMTVTAAGLSQANIMATLYPIPGNDFPKLPSLTVGSKGQNFDADVLLKAFDKVSHAISKEESRVNLSGIFVEHEDENTNFIATDGHRLACFTHKGKFLYPSILIPQKGIKLLKLWLKKHNNFLVHLDNNKLYFETLGNQLIVQLVDANFPDYKQTIPEDNDVQFTLHKKALNDALVRIVALTSDKYKSFKLTSNGEISVRSNDCEYGVIKEVMDATCTHEITIGLNAQYIIDILKVIDGDSITLHLKDEKTQAMLIDGNGKFVIMPMRL